MNQTNAEGEPHGLLEQYFKNGQLASKRNYLNGQYHGLYEEYFKDVKEALAYIKVRVQKYKDSI